MQSVAEGDRPLDNVGDRRSDGPQRIGFVRPALGTAEMGKENDLAALAGDFLDGRRDAFDAGRIRHTAVFGRNVEVDAQENALAGDFGVVERAEWCGHECVAFDKSENDRGAGAPRRDSRGNQSGE